MKINVIGNCDKNIKTEIRESVKATIKFLGQPEFVEVSVKLVDAKEIRELNLRTRNIDKETDVLSYPSFNLVAGEKLKECDIKESSFDGKNIYIGDCALCMEVAGRQASENGVSIEAEVRKLVTHSILHLLGFDHIKDEDYLKMHEIEVALLGEY